MKSKLPKQKINAMATISILLNGEIREVPEAIKLDELLGFFSMPKQRIAIEVNSRVIRRPEWQETPVNEGDKIEVVHFVGGG